MINFDEEFEEEQFEDDESDKNESDSSLAAFDQSFEFILRTIPGAIKSYYDKLIEEGFDTNHAFILARDYQLSILQGISPRLSED